MLSKEEFENVYNTHFDAIRNVVFYRSGDPDIASDVAQDVFLRVWEKRLSLNGDHLKSLLYKMAIDCYIDKYRKQQHFVEFESNMDPTDDAERSPEDEMTFSELAAAYAKALEQMPEKQRTVFIMNREEGMKYAEIAERLNISLKTVEKHITAALRELRTKLL
jgi:RNA polymerase sigma-70 factor (ECF subfamily)